MHVCQLRAARALPAAGSAARCCRAGSAPRNHVGDALRRVIGRPRRAGTHTSHRAGAARSHRPSAPRSHIGRPWTPVHEFDVRGPASRKRTGRASPGSGRQQRAVPRVKQLVAGIRCAGSPAKRSTGPGNRCSETSVRPRPSRSRRPDRRPFACSAAGSDHPMQLQMVERGQDRIGGPGPLARRVEVLGFRTSQSPPRVRASR